jgi:hypothetical protein
MSHQMSNMNSKSQTQSSSGGPSAYPDWLLLTDYASKYRISVSTLRRRIKAGSQPYRFDGGRYYLPDQFNAHSYEVPYTEEPLHKAAEQPQAVAPKVVPHTAAAVLAASIAPKDEPLITTTSKLLNELKQAYTLILHEKEEQIVYLKEEIADLKTLVRVLESENARHVSDRDRRRADPLNGNKSSDSRTPDKGPFGNA